MRIELMAIKLVVGSVLALLAFASTQSIATESAVATELAGVQRAESPRTITDFELTDQSGQPRKFSRFRGAPVLVFFGFANCPDVCPLAMQQLKLLMESKDRDVLRAKVVMISVDGARDTPAVMKAYLQPLSKEFMGLTGPPLQVRNIAAQFSAVFFKGAPLDTSGAYRVDHTSQVYLVDAAGKLRATFFNAPLATLRSVTAEISREPN
jgi:protein SCO1/2